jgi:TetR/AcrR family transcriptional regulator, cholesterol catabolism regulator
MKQKDSLGNGPSERRDEVIRVAARLFAAKGYHATTLDQIAEEIGITKPALYYYITNKEDILRTIINRMLEPMQEVVIAGQSELPPKEKMRRMMRILILSAAERKETTLLAFEQANILPKRSRDALRRRQKEVERSMEQTLKEGVEKGDFQVSDVKMATFAILAVSNWLYRWYNPERGISPEEIADRNIELLENGFLKEHCRDKPKSG